MVACDAARVANGVSTTSHGWVGATTKVMPEYVAHATSVPAGLSICKAGFVTPGPGIAGEGVYAFACGDPTDNAAMTAAWKRLAFFSRVHFCLCYSARSLACPTSDRPL